MTNNKRLYRWLVVPVFMTPLAHAQTTLITDNGREVVVHEDGSWEFASQDRFATLPDGQRVRLKPDGSWVEDDTAVTVRQPSQPQVTPPARPFYSPVRFDVEELAIETHKEKAHKNTRTETNTVILVSVELDPGQTSGRTFTISSQDVSLKDSAGNSYDILSVLPARLTVEPGDEAYFEIRAYDSPGWRFGKHYDIVLDAALTGTGEAIELEVPLSMAVNKKLEN